MSGDLALWWRGRAARASSGCCSVMLALAAFVLGWLLVVRPLADALDAAKTRHGAAVVALGEARARAEPGARRRRAAPRRCRSTA